MIEIRSHYGSRKMRRYRGYLACILVCVGVASPLSAQKSDSELYQEAESRFRLKEYSFALNRYDLLLQEHPRSSLIPDVQFRRAVSLFRLGRQQEAMSLFESIQDRYTSTQFLAFVPFWIGVIEYNSGDYARAAEFLRSYIEAGEPSLLRQARLYLAVCENELGNMEEAVELLEVIVAEGSPSVDDGYALIFLTSLYAKMGRHEEVLELTDTAAAVQLTLLDSQRMNLYRAEALWSNEDFEAARVIYEVLTDAPPEYSSIAYQRLFVYQQRLGNEAALQQIVLDAETELSGNGAILAEFWVRIGIESYSQDRTDLAKSYFQRVWHMRDRIQMSGLVAVYLAEIEAQKGNISEALGYLTAFLDISDDRRELILYRIGTTNLKVGNWEAAAEALAFFLSEYPASLSADEAAYQNAYALYKLGLFTEAVTLVDEVLTSARGGALTSQFLLLKSVLHKENDNLKAAAAALQEYLPLNPHDARARMDLIKLYFRLGSFDQVISEISSVQESEPFSDPSSTYYLLAQYMYGLAHIPKQEYALAAEIFSKLSLSQVQDAGLLVIYPYLLHYRGWALYRDGRYADAEKNFAALIDGVPDHELQPRSAYLAGWCAYVQGKYGQAGTYLLKMGRGADEVLRIKSDFIYAKTLLQQGKTEEAAILFENIYLENPQSELSDDALYEYAGVLVALEKIDEATDYYEQVWLDYPGSILAEESMYKRGEILFSDGRYEAARDAFYEYRLNFPKGTLYDAALYWGGVAAYESGEAFRAVLLWQKLIESHTDSAFRADSLLRTAEIYEDSGDFRKSLNFYGELLQFYPEEAKAVSADLRSEKLRYLILGKGEREAELSALIDKEGSATQTGRAAIYELARIYIYKSGSSQNLAPDLLDELIGQIEVDQSHAAKAYYLYGEYYYRKNELQKAAHSFLQAVLTNPTDTDLSAQSLYKAAEMAKIVGNLEDAEVLVERIETLFPSSPWVDEGRKLLGDADE